MRQYKLDIYADVEKEARVFNKKAGEQLKLENIIKPIVMKPNSSIRG